MPEAERVYLSSRMNILLVTETYLPFISGVSSSSDSIARFLAGKHHTVTVVSPKPVLPGAATPLSGLTFATTPSVRDPVYKGKPMTIFPFGFPVIFRLLKRKHVDLVHIQEPGSLGLSALCAATLLHIPTVGALHFTPDQVARMITGTSNSVIRTIAESYIRIVYGWYDAIMVPTQTFADFLRALGIRTRIQVVSNGVDTNDYVPSPKKQRRGSAGFLYIGRLDKDKNVATLIEALPHTKPGITLTIAGIGKDKQELVDLAHRLHVDSKIIWKGSVSEAEMKSLYAQSDGFIIMAEFEIQSIVTLQALASGLPVLGAKAGALPELIHDGENGYTLAPHDAQGLARRMNELSDDPALRARMGKMSRTISLTHHKPTVLGRLEALYRDVIRIQADSGLAKET